MGSRSNVYGFQGRCYGNGVTQFTGYKDTQIKNMMYKQMDGSVMQLNVVCFILNVLSVSQNSSQRNCIKRAKIFGEADTWLLQSFSWISGNI